MFNRKFWRAVVERALKTLGQTAAALLIANGTGLLDTDWLGLLSAAGMAALLSVLTNIGVGAATDGGPSIGNVEVVSEEPNPRRELGVDP